MVNTKAILNRLNKQPFGFLPLSVLCVFIYVILFYVCNLFFMMIAIKPGISDFLSIKLFSNVTVFNAAVFGNVLFIGFLLFSFLSFIVSKGNRNKIAIPHWVAYIFSFFLLTFTQIHLYKIGEEFCEHPY